MTHLLAVQKCTEFVGTCACMTRPLGSIPSNVAQLVLSCCCILSDLIDDSQSQYALVLGVDDGLQQPHWRERLKMPRSLLAALAVQCLLLREEGGWVAAMLL